MQAHTSRLRVNPRARVDLGLRVNPKEMNTATIRSCTLPQKNIP